MAGRRKTRKYKQKWNKVIKEKNGILVRMTTKLTLNFEQKKWPNLLWMNFGRPFSFKLLYMNEGYCMCPNQRITFKKLL